ncbi:MULTISPECIES: SDR family NAD(P)-dependent oxidoreductase [unclassified Mycobacterium]|uniref:SDR family NAD(P)-dependent oxidoreductase n=1 Tax=unclassified Mycobacterium TaxID=2642494 RepID=UPI0029C92CE2|nr:MULTISPECIES: SDR family NAD(P)-dependent oxidoreductase [unclassified Mycobacterium]
MTAGRFEGRRALVTGASRGIGAGIAQRLAAEGADVVLVARTLDSIPDIAGSLTQTQEALRKYGTRVGTVVADLADEQSRARMIPAAEEFLGGSVDILVNNAVAAVMEPITDISVQTQRLAFECNVIAPLDLAQAVIPGMRAAGAGWIVNLTSAGARLHEGPPFHLGPQGSTMELYGVTKAALNRATSGLAGDLHGSGVRVNAVGPQVAVMSEGFKALIGDALPAEMFESVEEIVEAVVALCDCPEDCTGKIASSLDLIAELGLDVYGLDGLARD